MKTAFIDSGLLAAIFLLGANALLAQEGALRGKVTVKDSGKPVANATIILEGTKHKASTDTEGEFALLGIWPGAYSARVSCTGYADLVMTEVRVHAFMTTTVDFKLATGTEQRLTFPAGLENTLDQTGTVHLLSSEYIQNSPVRGLENLLQLESGAIEQNGNLHIRGGEPGELSFFVNGVTATNPFLQYGAMTIEAIPEAIEEVQLYTGAFGAEFGHANSALVHTVLRTGGADFKASLDYRTDNLARPGEQFLGTSSFGYRHAVATLGGPLGNNLRYFAAAQHNYLRNRTISFVEPFRFDNLKDDGLSGRPPGELLPGPIIYERNYLPHNWLQNNAVQGNLVFSTKPLSVRLTAGYTHDRQPRGTDTFTQSLSNYFNLERSRENTTKTGLAGLRATHSLSPSTFYAVNLFYSNRSFESADPDFGSDWMNYADGYSGDWQSRYQGPLAHSTIFGFRIAPRGAPNNSYEKNKQSNLGVSADFTSLLNKRWQVKAGARFDRWTFRSYAVGAIASALTYLYGVDGKTPRQFPSPEVRALELARRGNINYLGYDVDGREVDSGNSGPRQPNYVSFYLQNQYEFRGVLLNLGGRYERIASKDFAVTDVDPITGALIESEAEPSSHFLPRFGFTLPLHEQTLLHGSFGKYIEPFIGFGFSADSERQTKYELGLRQKIGARTELNGVFFSRTDKLPIGDGEFITGAKGVELNFDLRRYRHLSAQLRYNWTDLDDGKLAGIDRSALIVVSRKFISQPHRAVALLDYRFDKDEGGKIFRGMGVHAILSAMSGHEYMKLTALQNLGQANPFNVGVRSLLDPRFAQSVEKAETPWNFQIDLGVNKVFALAGADLEIYVHALNLFNAKNVLNVYPTTGEPDDDGWLSSPLAAPFLTIPNYAAFYRAINLDNRWAYTSATGNDLYGQPRQLRLGLRLGL